MYVNEISGLLDLVDDNRREIAVCLLGPSGIGKTESVFRWAEEHGRDVVMKILSQCLPTEISGMAMPDAETKRMSVFDCEQLMSLKDGDILFLDELLEAPEPVFKACLTMIQERKMVSGRALPDIMIVAASNPLSSPSLLKLSYRQRFMFVNIEFNKVQWRKHIWERYGIAVNHGLELYLNDDSESWNVCTPRTMTKLLAMAKGIAGDAGVIKDCDPKALMFKKMVKSMGFTDGLYNKLREQLESSKVKSQVIDTIVDISEKDQFSAREISDICNHLLAANDEDILTVIESLSFADQVLEKLDETELSLPGQDEDQEVS